MRLPTREHYAQPLVKLKQIRNFYAMERAKKLNELDVFGLTKQVIMGMGMEAEAIITELKLNQDYARKKT